jgi:hypothetical protein
VGATGPLKTVASTSSTSLSTPDHRDAPASPSSPEFASRSLTSGGQDAWLVDLREELSRDFHVQFQRTGRGSRCAEGSELAAPWKTGGTAVVEP